MQLDPAPSNPFVLFDAWATRAREDDPAYWNGMAVASVDADGRPSCRIVLLKDVEAGGFVFFTNYHSRKGAAFAADDRVAATFWWSPSERQVRIEGRLDKVEPAASDAYFDSRPEGSRLAAIASAQSQPIASFDELEAHYAAVVAEHAGKVPQRPAHWGGYRITPERIEFWQGRANRLHHRLLYGRDGDAWTTAVLQP